MTISETYADLGGGANTAHRPTSHRHRYDQASGWCGCGRRDDGQLAEGSPAWKTAMGAVA